MRSRKSLSGLVLLCCHMEQECTSSQAHVSTQSPINRRNQRQIPTKPNYAVVKNQRHWAEIDCLTILLNFNRQTGPLWIIAAIPDNQTHKMFQLVSKTCNSELEHTIR